MAKITWDADGERFYETGVRNGVLYDYDTSTSEYKPGVAWNGLSSVSETPSGAEPTAIYADDMKYLNLYSAEELGGTIEAYTYPSEFEKCDGSAALTAGVKGVVMGQQDRKMFGLCYRTTKGNDVQGNSYGYKLHLLYGCRVSPSERNYQTINDSPEANTFSWEYTTTPIKFTVDNNEYATALITIDSTLVNAEQLKALEAILYGTETEAPRLPKPAEIATMFTANVAG